MSFTNKVVIVTGASSGIGASTAELFAKEGAHVVMVGRNQTKLADVAARCQRVGEAPLVVRADVAVESEAESIIERTIATYGRLDVLVNNAGILRFCSVADDDLVATYDRVFATNVRAVVHLTKLAVPHLKTTRGNIVNVSSSISTKSVPFYSMYGASKAALDYFTRNTAVELAAAGVRANIVSPGPVKTDIMENTGQELPFDGSNIKIPLGRMADPEEIADLILFLASERAKSITGSNYLSDNGMNLM